MPIPAQVSQRLPTMDSNDSLLFVLAELAVFGSERDGVGDEDNGTDDDGNTASKMFGGTD